MEDSLLICAEKVHDDKRCSPVFEYDTANGAGNGKPGSGWCGCGAAGGDECAGADNPTATNAIYRVVMIPSKFGAAFLITAAVVTVVYGGVGFALGQRQGRSVADGGPLAIHPHYPSAQTTRLHVRPQKCMPLTGRRCGQALVRGRGAGGRWRRLHASSRGGECGRRFRGTRGACFRPS